eukprot:TRINITY_DN15707_c0_g1_i1.p1 TRINITY_DN15707_c0_g1~~TRINITY_DN15707_c0_g1_i1.p1  ORF type:complete len:355 (-),score=164.14 TRINITY_DN15707_c0_g1_i1:174-1238(-)
MGACMGKGEGNKEEAAANKKIEAQLRKDRKELEHEVKLLLLGAGESGKSTITKQMKIIHLKGYTPEECQSYKDIIHSNIIMAMRSIVNAGERLGINSILPENKAKAELFTTNEILFEQKVTPEIAAAVKALWVDPGIQEIYARANEFQLIDSAAFFFENIDRVSADDFVPTADDVLRARARTTGITEIAFDLQSIRWRMVDVGGQRNERKKWIHCFQDVTALIFCVATSEYDQKLYEDERVNRMHESITLFEEICNCQWFSETSIVLFLNKSDLFEEKIKHVDLAVCFDDYTGGCDKDAGLKYLKSKFCKLNKNPDKMIYVHVTCATDTENIRFVFKAVRDIVIRETMQRNNLQ